MLTYFLLCLLAPVQWPHPVFAKRPSFETGYFELFNQPNVDLVDLPNDHITHITPDGIVASSTGLHEVDVIIWATGFNAINGVLGTLRITGVDQTSSLQEEWNGPDGKLTYLGYAVPGFPNMLLGAGPQSLGVRANGGAYSEIQGRWMTQLITHMRDNGISAFDVKPSAAREYKLTFLEQPGKTLVGSAPSFHDGGNIPGARREPQYWVGSLQGYVAISNACREGGYKEFDFVYRRPVPLQT